MRKKKVEKNLRLLPFYDKIKMQPVVACCPRVASSLLNWEYCYRSQYSKLP